MKFIEKLRLINMDLRLDYHQFFLALWQPQSERIHHYHSKLKSAAPQHENRRGSPRLGCFHSESAIIISESLNKCVQGLLVSLQLDA